MRLSGLVLTALVSTIASSAVAAASADLSLALTNGTTSTPPGTDTTYTLTYTNLGPDDASGVSMNYTHSVASTFVSMSASPGWSCTIPPVGMNGTITCTMPSLVSGASGSFLIAVHLSAAATGILTSTATITSSTSDPTPGNNSATDSDTIVPAAPVPAIPTLTEWAMILFGTLLAGGAALHLHRRRQTA